MAIKINIEVPLDPQYWGSDATELTAAAGAKLHAEYLLDYAGQNWRDATVTAGLVRAGGGVISASDNDDLRPDIAGKIEAYSNETWAEHLEEALRPLVSEY